MNILFLDDDETRHREFCAEVEKRGINSHLPYRSYTVQLAKENLDRWSPFDLVFLDHDLDGHVYVQETEGTGVEVCQYIAAMPVELRPKRVVVHSWNIDGALRMIRILSQARVRCVAQMFGTPECFSYLDKLKESYGKEM